MEHGGLLYQAFIYLLAAVVSVPVAKRLGLGSVLGYLVAGVLIGPYALGIVGDQAEVLHFAEFGVVMMLFLVGLELKPSLVWRLRGPILGLGGLQVLVTALAIGALISAMGALTSAESVPWRMAAAVGVIFAMSSTAIALQSLNEKGLTATEGGQAAFSVLLFQDIAVIPILALLPFLAYAAPLPQGPGDAGHGLLIESLPPWQQALVIVGAIVTLVAVARFLSRPFFRFIAAARLREVFTASTLLLVIGVALAMQQVGLSPALGSFLAGVVLAESEYRHELETDIEPFKGLLLGLFFLSIGAGIDFGLLWADPLLVLGLVAALVVVKALLLFALGSVFRLPMSARVLFSLVLAQGGEFAFVLLAFSTQNHVLTPELAGLAVVVVALSMVLAPLLLIVNERLLQPLLQTKGAQREADAITEQENPVIIAGFGRFGQIVGRLLLANNIPVTVLDHDAGQVDTLRRFGFKVFFGDASRPDLLHSAGAQQARLLVLALDDAAKTLLIAEQARQHFPHLRVLARATDRVQAYELLRAGVESIHRETFDSALAMGVDALQALGVRAYQALRAGRAFRKHDEASLRELSGLRLDHKQYISRRNQLREELEKVLSTDLSDFSGQDDSAWDSIPRSEN